MGRIGCFEPEGWPAFEVAYTLSPAERLGAAPGPQVPFFGATAVLYVYPDPDDSSESP